MDSKIFYEHFFEVVSNDDTAEVEKTGNYWK